MAGTLFGLGLSQQFDVSGRPMLGALLYTYLAGTTTPAPTYRDSGLSLLLPWPIAADATGRLPQFWLPDGTYRARLTNSVGALQFDEDNVLAIGPSTGTGGGGPTINPDSILQTGDWKFRAEQGQVSGWVRLNGKTIGSASSGATERANADCQALFQYAWNTYNNTICAVPGGRGASAVADWGGNKQITLLNMQGRSPLGLADMGAVDGGLLNSVPFSVGDRVTPGSFCGENLHTLVEAELGFHDHPIVDQQHQHAFDFQQVQVGAGAGPFVSNLQGSGNTKNTSTAFTGITTTQNETFGGSSHNTVQLGVVGTWYWRL